jgi:hypothetical protein
MGRGALIMVLGATFSLLIYSGDSYNFANMSYQNYQAYFDSTTAHNIAVSGANVGANEVFENPTWNAGYSNIPFDSGSYTVTVRKFPTDTVNIEIISTGTYGSQTDSVLVVLSPSNFAKYGVYLANMSGVEWYTGDSVFGPMHVNGTMNVGGTPVFEGKVTTLSGTSPATLPSGSTKPVFAGGYQSGVNVPLPLTFAGVETAAVHNGKVFVAPSSPSGQYTVSFYFLAGGTVNYTAYKGTTLEASGTGVALTTLAPDSAIWVENGELVVEGVFHGRLTIACTGSGGTNGDVYFDSCLTYASDPRTNPNSTDELGITVDNNAIVPLPPNYPTQTTPAPLHDWLLECALMTRTGSFSANLVSQMGILGYVTFVGSLDSYDIGAFSVSNGSNQIEYGYSNRFQFDTRFYDSSPPYYPNTGAFELLSWRE